MGHIWNSYGFDMGRDPPYQTCMMPYTVSVLSYRWETDTNFVKIHTISMCGNDQYGLWEWYGMIAMRRNDMGIAWEL